MKGKRRDEMERRWIRKRMDNEGEESRKAGSCCELNTVLLA